MLCSCHRAKCSDCLLCSKCECKCPPKKRPKRSRRSRPSYAELSDDDENTQVLPSLASKDTCVMNTISSIRSTLKLNENLGRGMPSLKDRQSKDLSQLDNESVGRMTHFTTQVMDALCKIIYPKDPMALAQLVCNKKLKGIDNLTEDSKLRDNLKKLSASLPQKSLQRRVILGAVASTYKTEVLAKEFGMGKKLISESRKAFRFMEQGNSLQLPVRHIASYDKLAVQNAVNFILQESNVQRVIRGSTFSVHSAIILNGVEVIDFPKFVLKKVVEHVLRDYIEQFPESSDRIGNTSFKKLAKALTSSGSTSTDDNQETGRVDYTSISLLNDNFALIRRILEKSTSANVLLRIADALEIFLKSTESHECVITNPEFAFGSEDQKEYCSTCELPSRVMQYFKSESISEVYQKLLDECHHKIMLYQGHVVRVNNQRNAINELIDNLLLNQALVVLDFNEKAFGIGGSWHGSMVYTRSALPEDDSRHNTTYYDHISSNGYNTRQDYQAVLSYFEAICMRLVVDFPNVTQLYVQSDNLHCYKTPEVIFSMFQIAKQNGLELLSYLYTGVEGGKGPMDGHFAAAKKHLARYSDDDDTIGNAIVTPIDIVNGLRANGGVTNTSMAEMVSINRPRISAFVKSNKQIIKRLSVLRKYLEIQYDSEEIKGFQYSKYSSSSTSLPDVIISISDSSDGRRVRQVLYEYHKGMNIEDRITTVVDDDNNEYEELPETDIGIVTGCRVFSHVRRGQEQGTYKSDNEDDPLQCRVCKKRFSHLANLSQHVCKGVTGQRDLVHYGLCFAYDQQQKQPADNNTSDSNINLFECVPSTIPSVGIAAGWAQPPDSRMPYGQNYADRFEKEIVKMFQHTKSLRSPNKVLEKLRQLYPERLDLPSECEIKQAIAILTPKQNAGHTLTLSL